MRDLALPLYLIASFGIGAIPYGVVIGRVFFHTDIRGAGSGNIGAANALRAFGKTGALAVLVLDALKGFVPALAGFDVGALFHRPVVVAAAGGFAALLGHCYSPWMLLRGGKGVATHLGVIFALSWPVGLVFVAAWLIVAVASGFSSAGSLLATLLAIPGLWVAVGPAGVAYGVAAALVILWRHRENIARLRTGSEHRMNLFARADPPAPDDERRTFV